MHELYQQFNCEYVNAILEVCLTRHDCTVPFHSYVLYVLWAQIHTSFHSKYTFSSKKISKLKYRIQPISCLNDSETQERGLQGVNCKIQKIPCGSMPPNSPHWLEAFAFGTRFGKSVIIYPTSVPAIVDIKTFHRNNKHAKKSSSMPMYMYMHGCNFLDYFLHSCNTSAIP